MALPLFFKDFGLELVDNALKLVGLLVFLRKEAVNLSLEVGVLAEKLLGLALLGVGLVGLHGELVLDLVELEGEVSLL